MDELEEYDEFEEDPDGALERALERYEWAVDDVRREVMERIDHPINIVGPKAGMRVLVVYHCQACGRGEVGRVVATKFGPVLLHYERDDATDFRAQVHKARNAGKRPKDRDLRHRPFTEVQLPAHDDAWHYFSTHYFFHCVVHGELDLVVNDEITDDIDAHDGKRPVQRSVPIGFGLRHLEPPSM